MYVVGLENYINVSRETLVQNGRDLPRVQRAATSRGLNGPTKIVRSSVRCSLSMDTDPRL
jgi:hypothetical protein